MNTNARKALHTLLKPHLPTGWVVLDHEPTAATVNKVNVWLTQTRVAKTAEAPASADLTTITVTLVEPTKVPPKADEKLEANLDTVLNAIDKIANLTWDTADRAVVDETYPGYKITVSFLTTRKQA